MLKIALIGLGDVSKVHLSAIENSATSLVAICDSDKSLERVIKEVPFYTNYKEMLKNEEIDCVHICLPHHLHYKVTKTCVEHGVNVFLEKPLAHNLEEGQALVELEKNNPDIKICLSLQNRYNRTVEKLQSLVASGEYGKITGIKGLVTWCRPESYYKDRPWRGKMKYAGGGVMINQAIHTLDLMQLFAGEMKSIKGSIANLLDYEVEVEDTASANIQFENGATGLFFSTITNATNSSVELQVICEKGKFTIKDSMLMQTNEEGRKEELIEDDKMTGQKFYYGASHEKLIHHFYKCIQEDTDNYVTAREAYTSLAMIDAIRTSSLENRTISMQQ